MIVENPYDTLETRKKTFFRFFFIFYDSRKPLWYSRDAYKNFFLIFFLIFFYDSRKPLWYSRDAIKNFFSIFFGVLFIIWKQTLWYPRHAIIFQSREEFSSFRPLLTNSNYNAGLIKPTKMWRTPIFSLSHFFPISHVNCSNNFPVIIR